MNKDFGRIITRLRKKKGLSQKEVCEALGVSQPLLSHYEKGIRECGLDFLDKAADFYEVSTDYLLGRTPDPLTGNEAEIITEQSEDTSKLKGNTYCMLNRKLTGSSSAVIYALLAEINNKRLSKYVSEYLSTANYLMFRMLYDLGKNDNSGVFELDKNGYEGYCASLLTLNAARINDIVNSGTLEGVKLDEGKMSEKFNESYNSLHHLIKNAEKALSQNFKI